MKPLPQNFTFTLSVWLSGGQIDGMIRVSVAYKTLRFNKPASLVYSD